MGTLEIVLLAAGAVIFIASFFIPVKQEKLKEETRNLAAQEVKNLVEQELENVREKLSELSGEEMKQQIEKSERTMERISNEKIMAVNEYSDTVLDEIHKNHEEVVFLYDILKGKKESLSESYGKAEKNIQELLQQVRDSEITVREKLAEAERKQKEPVSGQETVRAARAKKAASPETKGQKKEAETPAFSPFVPDKVEVTPKKRVAEKAVKPETESGEKPAAEEKEAGRKPAAKKASKPAAEKEIKPAAGKEAEPVTGGNSNGRILELHSAGKSNMAIARELGLGVGEVKLVIDLYEGLR